MAQTRLRRPGIAGVSTNRVRLMEKSAALAKNTLVACRVLAFWEFGISRFPTYLTSASKASFWVLPYADLAGCM